MLSEVYIPETITVHLGPPNSDAENVSIPFTDYLKMLPQVKFTQPGLMLP